MSQPVESLTLGLIIIFLFLVLAILCVGSTVDFIGWILDSI